jgi:hypothetical protein
MNQQILKEETSLNCCNMFWFDYAVVGFEQIIIQENYKKWYN